MWKEKKHDLHNMQESYVLIDWEPMTLKLESLGKCTFIWLPSRLVREWEWGFCHVGIYCDVGKCIAYASPYHIEFPVSRVGILP